MRYDLKKSKYYTTLLKSKKFNHENFFFIFTIETPYEEQIAQTWQNRYWIMNSFLPFLSQLSRKTGPAARLETVNWNVRGEGQENRSQLLATP